MTTTTALPTGTWRLDKAATTVTVTAKKMALFDIPATITVNSGVIEIDQNGQISKVEVVVDAASYRSKNNKRNEHVIGGDFLDSDTYPTIGFNTSSVTATSSGYKADGTVSVKGGQSPVAITIDAVTFDDTNGTFIAKATIDRNTIGVGKLPAFVIGNDLVLTVEATVAKSV